MLTPEYLQEVEFNKVVEIYDKLNISIMADIIERVSQMQEVTSTTKDQLKILAQSNGKEIFEKALEEASTLRAKTKKELKLIFKQMIKEDMKGYKELYKYRKKTFQLSATQKKLLNQGFKQTNNTLKNFTNTIAFSSKQAYVEAIDEAYYKVVTGAFNYATVINQTAQKLADKGITLRDKRGRNVQLETAIRRNIRWGLQETANKINRNIEDELGCNGYEVSAHIGARPSHAEEQGKQFALTKEDANKYGVGLWADVEELWQEYNCRHSYSGIILGISEPVYTKKELEHYKNATVKLEGKEVPYYEATQKQRQLENAIRKQKRTVQILEKSGQDATVSSMKLAQLNKELTSFCKETGLEKDYSRINISKNHFFNENKKDYSTKIEKYARITNNGELNKAFKETLMDTYERNRNELDLNMTPLEELKDNKFSPFEVNFGNMDCKLAKEWAKQFEMLSDEYYTTCTKVTQTKIYDGNLYRPDVINRTELNYYMSNSEILINNNLTDYDGFMERLSKMIGSGHAVDIDIKDYKKYIATHEFAHTLSYVNQEKYKTFVGADIEKTKEFNNAIKGLYKEYKNELSALSEEARELDVKFVMETNNYTDEDNARRKEIANKIKKTTISRYAGKNEDEFMAEAFVDYKYGTNKSDYSAKVGNLIEEYYGRKK